MDKYNLNQEQQRAIEILKSGKNLCIIGAGGVGKSYIINTYSEMMKKKNVLRFAPTGIAALQIAGVTLHSGFGLPRTIIDNPKRIKPKPELYEADVIIIDEVSMIRIDVFDAIIEMVDRINKIRKIRGLDDVQLILIGDFLQLPPVAVGREVEILKELYPESDGFYAFSSPRWNELNLQYVFLTQVMRQSNETFIRALNEIRYGKTTPVSYLNKRLDAGLGDKAIVLTGLNRKAAEINQEKLDALPEREKTFLAQTEGIVNDADMCVEKIVKLKVGCRVMALKNDQHFKNGSLGVVTDIVGQKITVVFDENPTLPVKIGRSTWAVYAYETGEEYVDEKGITRKHINKIVSGQYSQIPLKLAYAITIHKSQGQTFDEVKLYPYAWDNGQLYVALSRVKSYEGLELMTPIYPKYVKTSPEVIRFYKQIAKAQKELE